MWRKVTGLWCWRHGSDHLMHAASACRHSACKTRTGHEFSHALYLYLYAFYNHGYISNGIKHASLKGTFGVTWKCSSKGRSFQSEHSKVNVINWGGLLTNSWTFELWIPLPDSGQNLMKITEPLLWGQFCEGWIEKNVLINMWEASTYNSSSET